MAAFEGSKIGSSDRSRFTNVQSSSTQAAKGNRYPRQQMNYGNPYSSGNQCPIGPHKWKENGFIWNNKAIERGNPHSEPNLVPLKAHGNFQMWNGRFGQDNSRAMPGFGDLTSILKIRTLGQTERETLTSEDGPSSLIDPVILNRVKDNLESWCRAQWGKDININILPNDFFIIEFMSNEEKWQAKNKGPYILDGIEVHIIDWQPNFNPRTHVLPDSKVWIRFYNCPSDYWHIDVIKDI
ncbi:hypothetical protein SUGI_0055580 [Cryptomeria japonica]|nr:hypothetical protein SUGI_0055580 [Cryptomeria japonica]